MARLLPSTPDLSSLDESGPRVIGIDGDEADDLLAAMASGTARELLAALHEDPAAASELADEVDTSLQNAQYHLGRLEESGAVEVIDTVYSEKGREMKVYGPADRPLVVVAGGEEQTAGLKAAVMNLLGGLGLVGVVGLLVQALVGGPPFGSDGAAPKAGGGDGGGAFAVQDVATPSPARGAGSGVLDLLTEPGVLFVLGGVTVLLIGFAAWYAGTRIE